MAELDTVIAVRSKYPTPLGDKRAAFLLELAGVLGGGLLKKPSGNNITLHDGTLVAGDIIFYKDHIWDVLINAGGEFSPEMTPDELPDRPSWQDKGVGDASRYYNVSPIALPSPPQPPGTIPAPVVDLTPILAEIEALKVFQTRLRTYVESLDGVLEGHAAKISALESKTAPRTIRTEKGGGWLAHSHEVKL